MMDKHVLKIKNISQYEIVMEETMFIRISGNFQYENCCIKLYKLPENKKQGVLEITKIQDGKEKNKSLHTINSESVTQIGPGENDAASSSIFIESTIVSFVMFTTSKESQIEWLESLCSYLLPKRKDEKRTSLDSCQETFSKKVFRVDSIHSSDFETEEKDLTLEIQDKTKLVLKSRNQEKTLETWQINEIKSFKFNEGLFKIYVGRRRSYVEAMKHFEFHMPNEEKKKLKHFLSDILKRRKESSNFKSSQSTEEIPITKSTSTTSTTSTNNKYKTVPPPKSKIVTNLGSPPVVPSPPAPFGVKPNFGQARPTGPIRMNAVQSPRLEKIIPSSEEYEEPYEDFEKILQKQSPSDIIIPSGEEYEEPNDDPHEEQIHQFKRPEMTIGQLPKQPHHLGVSEVISKTLDQRRSMRLERYPGPENGDLYTHVRKNVIKNFLHNIVRHKT